MSEGAQVASRINCPVFGEFLSSALGSSEEDGVAGGGAYLRRAALGLFTPFGFLEMLATMKPLVAEKELAIAIERCNKFRSSIDIANT